MKKEIKVKKILDIRWALARWKSTGIFSLFPYPYPHPEENEPKEEEKEEKLSEKEGE